MPNDVSQHFHQRLLNKRNQRNQRGQNKLPSEPKNGAVIPRIEIKHVDSSPERDTDTMRPRARTMSPSLIRKVKHSSKEPKDNHLPKAKDIQLERVRNTLVIEKKKQRSISC